MEINLDKTEIIVYRNGGPLRRYESWTYRNQTINVTSLYKYMGLFFTPKLLWHAAQLTLTSQALRSLLATRSYQNIWLFTDV